MGKLKADEARKAIAELGTPTAEQQAHLDAALLNQEVLGILSASGTDRAAAGKKFVEMKGAGRIPAGETEYLMLWDAILSYAEAQGDAKTFEEGLGKLREKLGQNPGKKKYLDAKDAVLKKLKEKK